MNTETPSIIGIIAQHCGNPALAAFLTRWETLLFTWLVVILLSLCAWRASRVCAMVPKGMQNFMEMLVETVDDFTRGILGEHNRRYLPFIGTLFIYILCMNLMGHIPFFRAPTASLSTTFALSLCVFVFVQFTAFKELGPFGYADHLAGNPRGFLLYSVLIPGLLFCIHVVSEFTKPLTLCLRLRSNIWGDDYLLSLLSGFGLKGLPLMIFVALIAFIASVVQAMVFSLLTMVYFALVMKHDEPQTTAH